MLTKRYDASGEQGKETWSLLILLVFAVVVPTVCLLWFVAEAARNERMAVRQKLVEVCEKDLVRASQAWATSWQERLGRLTIGAEEGPGVRFSKLVTSGDLDSVVIYDEQGRASYPGSWEQKDVSSKPRDAAWLEAERMEYQENQPGAAVAAYRDIAERSVDPLIKARSWQAQIRCLLKIQDVNGATAVLHLLQAGYGDASDWEGRLIVPNVLLLLLKSTPSSDERFQQLWDLFVKCLTDYSETAMSSEQRIFLMEEGSALKAGMPFVALAAERLGAEYVQASPPRPQGDRLSAAVKDTLWHQAIAGNAVAIFRKERIASEIAAVAEENMSLSDATIEASPLSSSGEKEPFVTAPVGPTFPDWELRVYLDQDDLFSAAARKQILVYFWTAFLVILAILLLAALIARRVLRQMRLARLKNDFVATVSHELKTPLASIRVLVDTLLDGHCDDETKVREYLELVAKENARLSRLIDNFLTFSRMERNKRSFNLSEVCPEQLVKVAVEAMAERFKDAGCEIEVEIAPDLPQVYADEEAMARALINLLDNAIKYSGASKRIAIRCRPSGDEVLFEVEDNGIGLSRRDAKRVWDRFFQVDQTLSRKTGGCGLGLSIVKFIVDAHHGSIDVESKLGQGSTFRIQLKGNDDHRNGA